MPFPMGGADAGFGYHEKHNKNALLGKAIRLLIEGGSFPVVRDDPKFSDYIRSSLLNFEVNKLQRIGKCAYNEALGGVLVPNEYGRDASHKKVQDILKKIDRLTVKDVAALFGDPKAEYPFCDERPLLGPFDE